MMSSDCGLLLRSTRSSLLVSFRYVMWTHHNYQITTVSHIRRSCIHPSISPQIWKYINKHEPHHRTILYNMNMTWSCLFFGIVLKLHSFYEADPDLVAGIDWMIAARSNWTTPCLLTCIIMYIENCLMTALVNFLYVITVCDQIYQWTATGHQGWIEENLRRFITGLSGY